MREKVKDKGVFCCKQLVRLFADPEIEMLYRAPLRELLLGPYHMNYCPFCGHQLPPWLYYFRGLVMLTEYGCTNNAIEQSFRVRGLVPKEFNSDKWWKKRQHYPDFPTTDYPVRERQKVSLILGTPKNAPEVIEKRYVEHLAWMDEIGPPKGDFCCIDLWLKIYWLPYKPGESQLNTVALIIYEPEKRRYLIKNMSIFDELKEKRDEPKNFLRYMILYCIDCGSPLPKSLAKEWFEIVTRQFGVKDVFNRKELEQKLPPKYLSEKWWREAGL